MKKSLLLLLSALFGTLLNAQTFTRQWTNCDSDSTAITYVTDAATDKDGNTYMVGYKNYLGDEYYQTHMFLRKVNVSGAEEWIQYFNATQDSIDNAKAVGLDKKGNVYVTGTRIDTFCNICTYHSKISDIITMKYNPKGQRVWLNRYKPGDYILSKPEDIYVLPNGNSIVTGNEEFYNPQTFQWEKRAVIAALTSAGKTAWVSKVDTTIANNAAVDKAGNIYVAGAYNPYNYFTTTKPKAIKYSKNGDRVWTKTFDEYNKRGQYYFVYTDNTGNVYLNGQTDTMAFYNIARILTVKLNGVTGNELWNRKEEETSTTLPHYFGSFTVDNLGNSYVTGYSTYNSVFRDWVISKYNTAGTLQWTNHYAGTAGGDDIPIDIKTDAAGSVYVAGNTFGPTGNKYSYVLNVYNAAGALQYQNFYRNIASYLIPAALGLDNSGNVYVSGICVLKYRPNQLTATAGTDAITVTTNKELQVFPNPAKDMLYVRLDFTTDKISYSIVDNAGRILQQQTAPAKPTTGINISALKAGTYFIRIAAGNKNYTSKFIKL